MIALTFCLSFSLALPAAAPVAQEPSPAAEEAILGVVYERLETREATHANMMQQLLPEKVLWGNWFALSAFPYGGHESDGLALPLEPELQLSRMVRGGVGPDLDLEYAGKAGSTARWKALGRIEDRMVDLHFHEQAELMDEAICYLYGTIEAFEDTDFPVTMGSDDGLRFWLNGELLIDIDVPRGLNPDEHALSLPLKKGTNHLFAKVTEGFGGWAYQINSTRRLDTASDVYLEYLLNRDFPPSETAKHWRALTIPVPDDVVLEVGGLDFLQDGRPLVSTRRGDIWAVEGAYAVPPSDAKFSRWASGLHEPLGLAVRDESSEQAVYAVQRGELTRLVDENSDGRADLYGTASDGWGVSGNYHEFAFGPKFDRAGNAWVSLNVGFCGSLGKSTVPWRGWALKITPEGEVIPVCDGLRSPNGIGFWGNGDAFYVDNQGDYVGTNRLSFLGEGTWHGHPASLRWRDDLDGPSDRPEREPAAVWFPYKKMGQSAADIALDDTGGKFGPFTGQFFVGDQTLCSVMRVDLERIDGQYQGACFPFVQDLDCGVNRLAFASDGSLFVGETDRGWGSTGRRPYGLQRLIYSGEEPFEILHMRVKPDGFELEFTQDLDQAAVEAASSYSVSSYTYAYHAEYGAPEADTQELRILGAQQTGPRTVHLRVGPLREGYVHELHAGGVMNSSGKNLLHSEAYYTVQRVPGRERSGRDLPRALFLTHSAGFVHDVVKRPDPFVLSKAEERLMEASRGVLDLTVTQDCAVINADSLAKFDAVLFFTTGELPVPAGGGEALVDWVRRGGAFVGIHSATDTFYEFPQYQEMLGGVFNGHPWHQDVTVRVEQIRPGTIGLEPEFSIEDEIYQFRDWEPEPLRVLLSLDTQSVDASLGANADEFYPLAWIRPWGRGRVFYTALGHEQGAWDDANFIQHLMLGTEVALAADGDDSPAPPGSTPLWSIAPGASSEAADGWRHRGGQEFAWKVVDEGIEVVRGSGDLISEETFGDAVLHLEFRIPKIAEGLTGQARGNSGVYIHGRYEVQILDSYGLESGEGDCGGIYGAAAPMTNACSPPEVWQSYDINFTAARFDEAGVKVANARISVWHNGILIHDDQEVSAPTPGGLGTDEVAEGPLLLQDHGDAVRYRNIWIR